MKIRLIKKDKVLCAKHRPGHFEGVLAVINQFLTLIKPKYMFLGQKDYQQLHLIKNFIKNKFFTKVISCKTIRYKGSLAYSSRNFLLSKNDIKKATYVSKLVKKFYYDVKKDFKKVRKLKELKRKLIKNNLKVEYLELRNKVNLSKKINRSNFKIFISFYINKVRLIDNF